MIIPFDRKPDWRHPPLATLFLILINCLVYFVWQANDEQYEHEAFNYYFSSDLPEIELPAYRNYLANPSNPTAFPQLDLYLEEPGPEVDRLLLRLMIVDGPFLQHLRSDRVITPDNPAYEKWRLQHAEFESRLLQSFNFRFAQRNIDATPLTMLTSIFMHADFGHLLGNMLFLFLFGFVVEMTLGWSLYLFAYLLAGLVSNLFYLGIEPDSAFLAMGASGAVSGLAGMYTALFGMRRIRFFYTLLFYFDYIRAPAIILLPIWLLYELYDQFYANDNVNNLVHIGGLLSGALIAWLAKRYLPGINMAYLDAEENKKAFREKYQSGVQALAAMDTGRARRIFSELLEQQPNNVDLLLQLYNLSKLNPQDEAIHQAAQRILSLPAADRNTVKLVHDIFIDYVTRVQPNVRLSPEQMITLALRFAANDYLEDAEKLVLHLTTRASDFKRNPEGLMALATHYLRVHNRQKADKYFALLQELYPHSEEAHNARQAFGAV